MLNRKTFSHWAKVIEFAKNNPWLRWIPAVFLWIVGVLCFIVAFLGAIWFDGQVEVMLLMEKAPAEWRLKFWKLCCTAPADALLGFIALYAGWVLCRKKWKATGYAIIALILLLILRMIAIYLVHG